MLGGRHTCVTYTVIRVLRSLLALGPNQGSVNRNPFQSQSQEQRNQSFVSAKKWFFITSGGGRVRQKIILHDEGGGGVWKKVILYDKWVWGSDKKFFLPTKSGKFVSLLLQELLWAYEVTLQLVFWSLRGGSVKKWFSVKRWHNLWTAS